jgi:hypothetical protein
MKKTRKEQYIDKMAKQLKEWSTNIDELELKVSETKADVQAEISVRLREIKEKREALTQKLLELRETSDGAWETMKGGAETAWRDLTNALTEARDKFRKAA